MKNFAAVCVTSVLFVSVLGGCNDNKTNTAINQSAASNTTDTTSPTSTTADTSEYGPKPIDLSKMKVDKDLKSFTKTSSGLMYKDLVVGKGPSPVNGMPVTVNYTGYLEDGNVFDTSYKTGQPFVFQIGKGEVIKGWDEGVKSMKEGGKRRLIIPPDLGYGSQGQGPIPANATLYFDVELVKSGVSVPGH